MEPEIIQIAELLDSLIEKKLREREGRTSTRDEELTVNQVARLKNVDQRTVRGWISTGKIVAHKTPGGGVRILRSEVEKAA